jgi:spore maturation protein CgeB
MSTDNIPNVNYVHYFANERSFYPASEKRYDLTFSGSGNISRYVYLAAAKSISRKRGYQCQINVHSHDILSALSAGDYARMVRESRAVLVLSARAAPGVRVVTGRVQQTIASKALLIAEHCDSMNRLFTPYVHFIPFDSQKELAIAMEFSVTSQDLVGAITEAAYKKYRQEHSSAVVWARILDLCGIHNTELKSIQS